MNAARVIERVIAHGREMKVEPLRLQYNSAYELQLRTQARDDTLVPRRCEASHQAESGK